MATSTNQSLESKPIMGEKTKTQSVGLGLFGSRLKGFGAPQAGTYQLYRKMRANPTVAIARAAGMLPVKSAAWAYKESDDGAPEGAEDFIRAQFEPIRRRLMGEVLRSLDNGFAAFEKVWDIDKDGRMKYKKLKPLLVDVTRPIVDKDTGQYVGLKNKSIDLPAEKTFWYAHDAEAGDLFGRPRMENIRKEWCDWNTTVKRVGQYVQIAAAPVPLIQYPVGESQDVGGSKTANHELAEAIMHALADGQGIAMPMEFHDWAQDFLQKGMDPSSLLAWNISWIDAGKSRGKDFVDLMKHLESLMARGWLVPERAITEASTAGSRADSNSATDVALMVAEDLLEDIVECINDFLVNPLLEANWGPDARGTVKVVAEPIVDEKKAFIRTIIEKVLSSPVGPDLFQALADEIAVFEMAGIPLDEKAKERADKMNEEFDNLLENPEEEEEEVDENTGHLDDENTGHLDPKKSNKKKKKKKAAKKKGKKVTKKKKSTDA